MLPMPPACREHPKEKDTMGKDLEEQCKPGPWEPPGMLGTGEYSLHQAHRGTAEMALVDQVIVTKP